MIQVWEWLQGKKTYIALFVSFVDAVGIQAGWWTEMPFRHILEALGVAVALRSGLEKPGVK